MPPLSAELNTPGDGPAPPEKVGGRRNPPTPPAAAWDRVLRLVAVAVVASRCEDRRLEKGDNEMEDTTRTRAIKLVGECFLPGASHEHFLADESHAEQPAA